MWKNINIERCLSYIRGHVVPTTAVDHKPGSQTYPAQSKVPEPKILPEAKPSITICRMCGAGGRTVASQLVDLLQARTLARRQWTVFDNNLIEKVLEDHHLSRRIAEYLPENRKSFFTETIEKIRGLHPPTTVIVKQTVETILALATNGYVIVVGRASNVITEKLENVFHVRLVGSLKKRIARVEEVYGMGQTDAREYIKAQDTAKRLYLKTYFDRDIDDPLLYHMTINTDEIPYENAARLIGEAVIAASNLQPA